MPRIPKTKPKKFKKTEEVTKTVVAISSSEKNKKLKNPLSFFNYYFKKIVESIRHSEIYLFLKLLLIAETIFLLFSVFYLTYQTSYSRILPLYLNNNVEAHPYPLFSGNKELDTTSASYVVYEKDSRVIVYGKNEALRFSPASTAKVMSALVALEYYTLDKTLKAGDMTKVEGSKMGLVAGEEISVENLLYGLMLPSGNDAAYVLAVNYPGGVKGFIDAMNKKAKELKMANTHFVDPAGYDDENYTTAFDLARLAAVAIDNENFQKIVKTRIKTVYNKTYKISHELKNLNKLLGENGVVGIKTGYTDEAGGVLVTSFQENNRTYIVVVLKSKDRFQDSQELLSSVVKNIRLISY